jgi:surface carbohydrate biosynthesis protein
MERTKPTLLIPVELQVRELDPKLLLACVAARRGFPSVIGPRRELHFHIPSFPRSIYLSKSTTGGSSNVFKNLHRMRCKIVAWDEEALVSLPPETYYNHRLSPVSMGYVSHLLAWGEENAKLWRQYPDLPAEIPIHITGNPRGDLLRPELRAFYENEALELRRTYDEFILFNTNFNLINAFFSDMNLLIPDPEGGEKPILSRRAKSMGLRQEYAEGFSKHKRAILEDFKQLIPALDRSFSKYTIVIRPHPAENQEVYQEIAATCERVEVINKGNVVPWILAAKVLLHNGCTSGVEAHAMGIPTIAYRASVNELYDHDFHHLPNLLSHQCFTFDELRVTLGKILAGEIATADGDERHGLIRRHLAAQDGPLACERIVDVFEEMTVDLVALPGPTMREQIKGWYWGKKRRVKKWFRKYLPNMSHNRPEFLRHRYPEISLEQLQARIARFQQLLGNKAELKVQKVGKRFFRISG